MVLFNYAIREITAKLVYYGPGLGGKTTNLQKIHESLDPKATGKLISLATDADRTLFFDFLPLDLGYIGGYRIRFQLYTVPGQVHYNATRRLVLKGVDAIVFVADSQIEMIERNRESFDNLKENLVENGYDLAKTPIVFQFNKQDLPNVATPQEIADSLGIDLSRETVWETVATSGKGVFECLKAIIKLTISKLKRQFEDGNFDDSEDTEPEKPVEDKARFVAEAKEEAAEPEVEEEAAEPEAEEEAAEAEAEEEAAEAEAEEEAAEAEAEEETAEAEAEEETAEAEAEEETAEAEAEEVELEGMGKETAEPDEVDLETMLEEASAGEAPEPEEVSFETDRFAVDFPEEEIPEEEIPEEEIPEEEVSEEEVSEEEVSEEEVSEEEIPEEGIPEEGIPEEEIPEVPVTTSFEAGPEPEVDTDVLFPPEEPAALRETEVPGEPEDEMAFLRRKTVEIEGSLVAIQRTLEENRLLMNKVIDMVFGKVSGLSDAKRQAPRRGFLSRLLGGGTSRGGE